MKRRPNPRNSIAKDRALQINNNVAEEYVDHGDTSFATKAELCETILWLCNDHFAQLQRKDSALDDIFYLAIKARSYAEEWKDEKDATD
jgi:hypothetical protein